MMTNMKNKIISLLTICSLLSGCAITSNQNSNKEINKLTPKFEYELGKCLKDNTTIEYKTLNRGDNISIINEDDKYFYFDYNGMTLSILKDYVRTENDEPFEEYTGYTRSGSKFYSNKNLDESIHTFSLNDNVKVIDEVLDILIVEYDGQFGYMNSSQVSKKKISTYVAPKVKEEEHYESSGGGSSGGSSSGGDSGGGGSSAPTPSYNQDGDDMSLAYQGGGYHNHFLDTVQKINGTIKIDGTITYLSRTNRNDTVYVLSEDDNEYTILINGYSGKINKAYVRMDDEEAYQGFDGYTSGGAVAYKDFEKTKKHESFSTNEIVHIIDEVDNMYVISDDEGNEYYISKSVISKNKIYIAPKPKVEEKPQETYSGGGGSSGGEGSTPAPAPAEEFTPTMK